MARGMTRKDAVKDGYDRYDGGRQCERCGGYERYTSNSVCVQCARGQATGVARVTGSRAERTMNADAWRAAEEEGDLTFHRVTPCNQCKAEGIHDSTLRYTSNGGCVACQNRRATARYTKRQEKMKSPSVQPVIFAAARCEHTAHMQQLFPERPGHTLIYGRHALFHNLTGRYDSHNYGKCIFCRPDRAVMMWNVLTDMHTIPEQYQATWLLFKIITQPSAEYPLGYLEHCNRERIRAQNTKAAPKVDVSRLILPGDIING